MGFFRKSKFNGFWVVYTTALVCCEAQVLIFVDYACINDYGIWRGAFLWATDTRGSDLLGRAIRLGQKIPFADMASQIFGFK